jgi:hypothetical protein
VGSSGRNESGDLAVAVGCTEVSGGVVVSVLRARGGDADRETTEDGRGIARAGSSMICGARLAMSDV